MTLRRYDIRDKKASWAIIVIDTSIGYFSTVSDWGSYAYVWSDPGCEFRAFLASLDASYLHGKLMMGRPDRERYDGYETLKAIRKEVYETPDGPCGDELKLLEEHDIEGSERAFEDWCGETELGDARELRCTRPNQQSWSFCTKIWPLFAARLRDELAGEVAA